MIFEAMQQEYQYQQGYPQPGSGKKDGILKYVLLGIGCFVVFVAFLAAGGYFFYTIWKETSVPLDVVNAQLQALQENDFERAYMQCSRGFQEVTGFEEFQRFAYSHGLTKRGKQFSSNNRSMSGKTVKLVGHLKLQGSTSQPVEYRLIKENREWKVDYIKIDSGAEHATESRMSAPPPRRNQDLEIRDVRVEKAPASPVSTVQIHFRIYNFENEWSRGKARIHLVQDLATYGPDDQLLVNLSKDGIQELQESGDQEYTYADFTNTLSIPESYPSGKYNSKLLVHDRIGGGTAETTVQFDFP